MFSYKSGVLGGRFFVYYLFLLSLFSYGSAEEKLSIFWYYCSHTIDYRKTPFWKVICYVTELGWQIRLGLAHRNGIVAKRTTTLLRPFKIFAILNNFQKSLFGAINKTKNYKKKSQKKKLKQRKLISEYFHLRSTHATDYINKSIYTIKNTYTCKIY